MAHTMLIVSAVGDRQQNRGEIPKSIGKVTLVDRPSRWMRVFPYRIIFDSVVLQIDGTLESQREIAQPHFAYNVNCWGFSLF